MLKRGFKSQCERRSVELRRTLGLTDKCALCAGDLAHHLDVKVWSERDVDGVDQADIDQLVVKDPQSWSAFTIRIGSRYLVVYNSGQSRPRTNSVLMHELSHIMLGHELTSAGVSEEGHFMPTNYDRDQEDEANWLAGTLLLPRPALSSIRYRRMTDEAAMAHYLVSRDMLAWRFRMTGVDYQIANARKKRA